MIEQEKDKSGRILKSLWYVPVLFNKFKFCSNDCVFETSLEDFTERINMNNSALKHVMWTLVLQKATKFYFISKLTCVM